MAVEYARTIEDFNKLIDPCILACHCLGPEPSLYVLSAIDREEKKCKLPLYTGQSPSLPFFFFFFFVEFLIFFGAKMMSKFNKEMYKKIREKKNEPLSSIG